MAERSLPTERQSGLHPYRFPLVVVNLEGKLSGTGVHPDITLKEGDVISIPAGPAQPGGLLPSKTKGSPGVEPPRAWPPGEYLRNGFDKVRPMNRRLCG